MYKGLPAFTRTVMRRGGGEMVLCLHRRPLSKERRVGPGDVR